MRFNCDLFYNRDRGYSGNFCFENGKEIKIDCYGYSVYDCGALVHEMEFDFKTALCWSDFADTVQVVAGLSLPARKIMKFQRLSDYEMIAGIDGSHVRNDCRVTLKDRRSGWFASDF